MADTSNLTNFLGDIANAIRTKKETTEQIPAENFDQEILSIETGTNTSDATAMQNEILEGKTAYIADGKVTGTMPDTGTAKKVMSFPNNLNEAINQAFPTNITTISLYGIAFTNDGKYCARIIQSDGVFKLGLYTVSEDGLTLTLMKKKENDVEVDALYTLSGDASIGLIDGNVDNSSVSELARFVMVPNSFDNIYDCRLYIRGNNGTYRWNSLIHIDFKSDTPITDVDIFKFNSGSGVTEYSIIPIPGHTNRCIELVYINYYRLDLYLCSIDYTNKTITRISSAFALNARSPYTVVYDFSSDGRSMIVSQPNGNSGDGNPYAPYIVRFAEDFNSMKTTQITNGNPGVICLNTNGTLAFTNGKLFSIAYGSDTATAITRVGTANVISPFHTNDSNIGRAKAYFSYDNQRIIYCYDSAVRVYKIDLTGETTTSSYSPSISGTYRFSTQSINKEFVYTQSANAYGTLYKIGPDGEKVVSSLIYKNIDYTNTLDGNANSSDILSGKTAYANGKFLSGEIKDNGELNYTPSDLSQIIPKGYTSGGTISAADITALNDYKTCLGLTKIVLGESVLNPISDGLLLNLTSEESNVLNSNGVIWSDLMNSKKVSINNATVNSDFSIEFNGSNTYFDSKIAQGSLTDGYTIAVRIKPATWDNYKGVYGLHGGGYNGIVGLQYENGNLSVANIGASSPIKIPYSNVPTDTWSTVIIVYSSDGSGLAYINGELNSNTTGFGALSPYGNLIFGKAYDTSDRYFKGSMSHCIVYNRSLTEEEILSLNSYIIGGAK